MLTAIYIALILVSTALVAVVLLQSKGGGLGGIFGGDGSGMYRSKRGVEKTLFQITIGLAVGFLLLDLIAVLMHA